MQDLLDANNPQTQRMVEKGLLLYRQSFVSQVKLEDESANAIVQDVVPVKVHLDFMDILFSSCTCHADELCRHQLALFFYLLGHAGKVSAWLSEWRKPNKKELDLKNLQIMKASDLLKDNNASDPQYGEWIANFNDSFDTLIAENGKKPFSIAEMYYIYIRKLKNGSPFQNEWRLLYLLIGNVFTFKKLLQLSVEMEHTPEMINRYYRHIFQDLFNGVQDNLNKLSNFTFPFAFDQFLERLKDEGKDILTIQPYLRFESIQLYRILWTNLFTKKEWRKAELSRLLNQTTESFSESAATIHLHILLKNDKEANDGILALEEEVMPYMIYWIEYFNSRKAWDRMEAYVQSFIQQLKDYLQRDDDFDYCHEYAEMSMKVISSFCMAKNRMDILERAYIQTLPFSFRPYETFLYENQSYDKWMDLYAYMGLGLDYLNKEQMKTILEYDQSLLLSFYHRSIQEHIELKSREHYRVAVRQLKKLRTIYKKLKRTKDFERFLALTLDRTKRLRAFHEECRKGKLIHAEN